MNIPHLDNLITGAAPTDNKSMLVATPSESFDGRFMCKSPDLDGFIQVPNEEFIIIATTGQILVVGRELQSTNLLFVGHELMRHTVGYGVVHLDCTVTRTRTD